MVLSVPLAAYQERNTFLTKQAFHDTDNDDYIQFSLSTGANTIQSLAAPVAADAATKPSAAQQVAGTPIKYKIPISEAYHLDPERKVLSDMYEDLRSLDGVWSEEIPEGNYVRVTFEQDLIFINDITVYPRVVSGEPRIEVYEVDGDEMIAESTSLETDRYTKILLTNLRGSQDTFDLRIIDGSVEFDHIIDPTGQQTFTSSGTFTAPEGVTHVTVEAWGGGGGGGGSVPGHSGSVTPGIPLPASIAVNLTEYLNLGESVKVQPSVELAGNRFEVSLFDSLTITSRSVPYKTIQILPDLRVLITVSQVSHGGIIPPSANAEFGVHVENRGDAQEAFTLNFWYFDQAGKHVPGSSQYVEIGPHRSEVFQAVVPFTSPGTFLVTAEVRSASPDNGLFGTTQLTVIVPWLAVYFYFTIIAAGAILVGSIVAVILLFRAKNGMWAVPSS